MPRKKKAKKPTVPPYTLNDYKASKDTLLSTLRGLIQETEASQDIFTFLRPRPNLHTELLKLSGKAFLLGQMKDLNVLGQLSTRLLHIPDSLSFNLILPLMDKLQQEGSAAK